MRDRIRCDLYWGSLFFHYESIICLSFRLEWRFIPLRYCIVEKRILDELNANDCRIDQNRIIRKNIKKQCWMKNGIWNWISKSHFRPTLKTIGNEWLNNLRIGRVVDFHTKWIRSKCDWQQWLAILYHKP